MNAFAVWTIGWSGLTGFMVAQMPNIPTGIGFGVVMFEIWLVTLFVEKMK